MLSFFDQDPVKLPFKKQLNDKLKAIRDLIDDLLIYSQDHPEKPMASGVNLQVEMLCEKIFTEIDSGFRLLIRMGSRSDLAERILLFSDFKSELVIIQNKTRQKISDDGFPSEVKTCISKLSEKLIVILAIDFQEFGEACKDAIKSEEREFQKEMSIDKILQPAIDFFQEKGFESFTSNFFKEDTYQNFRFEKKGNNITLDYLSRFSAEITHFDNLNLSPYENFSNREYIPNFISSFLPSYFNIKLNLEEELRNKANEIFYVIYNKIDSLINQESDYDKVKTFMIKFTDRLNYFYHSINTSNCEKLKIDLFKESAYWLHDELTKKHKNMMSELLNFGFERNINLINALNLESGELLEKHYNMLLDLEFIDSSIKPKEFKQTITSDEAKLTKIKWKVVAKSNYPNLKLLLTILHILKEGKLIEQDIFKSYESISSYVSKRFVNMDGNDIEFSKSVFSDWKSEFFKKNNGDLIKYLSSKNIEDRKKLLRALEK